MAMLRIAVMKLAQKMRAKVRFRFEFSHFLNLKDLGGAAKPANSHQMRFARAPLLAVALEPCRLLSMKSLLFDRKSRGLRHEYEAFISLGVYPDFIFGRVVADVAIHATQFAGGCG